MTPPTRVAPSILSADFGRLREQVREVVDAGAEVIHVDVMDGHFVPPITMGPIAVEALRDFDVVLDVHLMIERPERQVAAFAEAGANHITIHAEATPSPHPTPPPAGGPPHVPLPPGAHPGPRLPRRPGDHPRHADRCVCRGRPRHR